MHRPNLSLQMTVAELLRDCPQAMPVIIRYHMACIGCSMSIFDTLEEAARNYALEPEQLITEIEQVIGQQ